MLIVAGLAAAPQSVIATAAAADQSLSGAQITQLDGLIAQQGRDVAISAIITDIVGLTKDNQTISCRAYGAVDPGTNDIRHIYLLPEGKGYLLDYFHADIVEVYWADKKMALIAALSGVRGEKPGPASFQQAQFGFAHETAWWAKYADTH
ncbi:MAG: hypothetical protein WA652_04860 [Xanthobacteraceae bacterium]|jgi:hypothetical protein